MGSGLTGTLPSSWTSLNLMQYFDLHNNRLSGQQPGITSNWDVVQYVHRVCQCRPLV